MTSFTPRLIMSILFLGSFMVSVYAQSPLPSNFEYATTLSGNLTRGILYRVDLNREILRKCKVDCGDMRVYSKEGKEVPYVIVESQTTKDRETSCPFEIKTYDFDRQKATVTLSLPEKHNPIDRITITTPDRDFRKTVTVSGSHDMAAWAVLAHSSMYDYSSQVDLRKLTVQFPESDYRFYRLTVTDEEGIAPDSEIVSLKYNGLDFSTNKLHNRKLTISAVAGLTPDPKEHEAVYDKSVITPADSSIDKDGNTVILIDAGIACNRISFSISNAYFYRDIRIFASETGGKDSYNSLTRDRIFRFLFPGNNEPRTHIEIPAGKYRFYKLIIENRNSPSLEIEEITVEWFKKYLFFSALDDESAYTLSFGNRDVAAPQYDLQKFVNQTNWHTAAFEVAQTGEIRHDPHYDPRIPQDSRALIENNILTIIVILLVAGMGLWIFMLLRKTGKVEGKG